MLSRNSTMKKNMQIELMVSTAVSGGKDRGGGGVGGVKSEVSE